MLPCGILQNDKILFKVKLLFYPNWEPSTSRCTCLEWKQRISAKPLQNRICYNGIRLIEFGKKGKSKKNPTPSESNF